MIYIFATKRGSHTFRDYLADWVGDLKSIFQVRLYENFLRWPTDSHGTYIFSDLERLTDEQLAVVIDYANQLQMEFPNVRVLNHPQRTLRRRGLLNSIFH